MFKTANVGTLDRVIRIVLGAALIAAPFLLSSPALDAPLARGILSIVGVVLIATAVVRFCPLYRMVGANTCGSPRG